MDNIPRLTVLIPKSGISAEDRISFFKYQYEQFLSESQTGYKTNLNLVSNSGVTVSTHQAILLPHTPYLQSLVENNESCGCADDVLNLFLPDWDQKVIQALVTLLYSGSAVVTSGEKNQLVKLMRELRIQISEDNLVTDVFPSPFTSHQNVSESSDQDKAETLVAPSPTIEASSSLGGNGIGEKIDCVKKIKIENEEIEELSPEQEKVMEELGYVLHILQSVNVKNELFFLKVRKPMEDVLSSLKFVPIELTIDVLPTEIKSSILEYLCDSGALVAAAVCQEWRDILNDRLNKLKTVKIENCCSNAYSCGEGKCFMPQEMLLSLKIVNLDVELCLSTPFTNVDAQVIADGLTSVSRFSIDSTNQNEPILSANQIGHLFDTLGRTNKTFESIELCGVNMIHLDQDKLIDTLLNVEELAFHQQVGEPQLDVTKFVEKILQSLTIKLQSLCLNYWEYPEHLSLDLADALCKMEHIALNFNFPLSLGTTRRLIENILTRNIRLEELVIIKQVNWQNLINPEDLKLLISKLDKIVLRGRFTSQQLDAVRILPGVQISGVFILNISKGIDTSRYFL